MRMRLIRPTSFKSIPHSYQIDWNLHETTAAHVFPFSHSCALEWRSKDQRTRKQKERIENSRRSQRTQRERAEQNWKRSTDSDLERNEKITLKTYFKEVEDQNRQRKEDQRIWFTKQEMKYRQKWKTEDLCMLRTQICAALQPPTDTLHKRILKSLIINSEIKKTLKEMKNKTQSSNYCWNKLSTDDSFDVIWQWHTVERRIKQKNCLNKMTLM